MFRVRFASGEETVFQSVDELAEGIQRGAVPPTAEIFHAKSQQWLPIAIHPVFEQAVPRVYAEPEEDPVSGAPTQIIPADEDQDGSVQIYQMVSKSGVELEQRRRPRWIGPAASVAAGLAILGGLAWVMLPSGGASVDLNRPLAAREMARPSSSSTFATQAIRTWDAAPSKLALRLARSSDSAFDQLANRARALGLTNLLDPVRLGAPDAVRNTRRSLATFEATLASHRAAERERWAAYADTATHLTATGAWTRSDVEEWRARMPAIESPAAMARSDSLLGALDRLYGLLFDQSGSYDLEPRGAHFTSLAAGDQYSEIRKALQHLATPRPDPPDHPEAIVSLLLSLVGDGSLPPHLDD